MATISLQCNNLSQLHSSVYFRLKLHTMTDSHWGSADTSLSEIHQDMSELLDKQVNAQKRV